MANTIKENKIIIWENPTILLSNNTTSSVLIEVDLSSYHNFFKEINKNFVDKEILCNLNVIVHNNITLLKNDIIFSIESNNLIKSIQFILDDYNGNNFNKNMILFFVIL
jgi:hypothetical protein